MKISHDEIYRIVFNKYPDLMDVKQVGGLLGVSTKTVYRLIEDGALESIKVGREHRVMKIALMQYLNVFPADDPDHSGLG